MATDEVSVTRRSELTCRHRSIDSKRPTSDLSKENEFQANLIERKQDLKTIIYNNSEADRTIRNIRSETNENISISSDLKENRTKVDAQTDGNDDDNSIIISGHRIYGSNGCSFGYCDDVVDNDVIRDDVIVDDVISQKRDARNDISDEDVDDDDDDDDDHHHHHPQHIDPNTPSLPSLALDKAEEIARKVWQAGWTVVHHHQLPGWLRDNDFLLRGHRPPLPSFTVCARSIFRIHTETGNIWTHLIGFVAFIVFAFIILCSSAPEVNWERKILFSTYFTGAILCLGFSWTFHTFQCHSEKLNKLFNKLDYCGISIQIMGSFLPWLHYCFYCQVLTKTVYTVIILVLGTTCIVVSLSDKFSTPKFRPVRAGTYIGFGLSSIVPVTHFIITEGFHRAIHVASLGWLILMACLYIGGALIYAARVPERIWPGKFDIWGHSHQIFHCCVVAAAFVHYIGMARAATHQFNFGDCMADTTIQRTAI